jgi:hypothetical protein
VTTRDVLVEQRRMASLGVGSRVTRLGAFSRRAASAPCEQTAIANRNLVERREQRIRTGIVGWDDPPLAPLSKKPPGWTVEHYVATRKRRDGAH